MTRKKTFRSGKVITLLENMSDGIEVIAEQQTDIRKDINVIKSDVEVIKSGIADIKYDLKEKVSYGEFEKMEKRMVRLEKLVFSKRA